MQIDKVLSSAEAAYQRAVDAGYVKTHSGGVKRYTAADFSNESTADAAKKTDPVSVTAASPQGATIHITIDQAPARGTK